MFDSSYIGLYIFVFFIVPFLKSINILAFLHAVGIRLSDKHLVYILPFFISLSAAPTSRDVISGISFESVCIMVLCSV